MAPRDHFRAHGRISVRIDALLRRQDDLELPVTIRNLGFGGAGVDIADPTLPRPAQATSAQIPLAVGLPVVLEVVTPVLWDPLYLPAKVVWNAPHPVEGYSARVGIRFEPLGATTLLSLFDVLTSQ